MANFVGEPAVLVGGIFDGRQLTVQPDLQKIEYPRCVMGTVSFDLSEEESSLKYPMHTHRYERIRRRTADGEVIFQEA